MKKVVFMLFAILLSSCLETIEQEEDIGPEIYEQVFLFSKSYESWVYRDTPTFDVSDSAILILRQRNLYLVNNEGVEESIVIPGIASGGSAKVIAIDARHAYLANQYNKVYKIDLATKTIVSQYSSERVRVIGYCKTDDELYIYEENHTSIDVYSGDFELKGHIEIGADLVNNLGIISVNDDYFIRKTTDLEGDYEIKLYDKAFNLLHEEQGLELINLVDDNCFFAGHYIKDDITNQNYFSIEKYQITNSNRFELVGHLGAIYYGAEPVDIHSLDGIKIVSNHGEVYLMTYNSSPLHESLLQSYAFSKLKHVD